MLSFAAAVLSFTLQGPVSLPGDAHGSVRHRPQLAESWDDLTPGQRKRALKNYQRYRELPPQKRRDIDKRYEKWKKLPRSDQERFRKKYEEYRGMGLVGDD